jgi:putative DNA primase/helicase
VYADLTSYLHSLEYFPDLSKIILDGKIHRFDRDGKLNAWLIGFLNHTKKGQPYVVAQFGDWKTGEVETFTSAVRLSKEEKKQVSTDIEKQKIKVEEEKQKLHDQGAIEAESIFLQATDNPASDYLTRKKIQFLYGAKTVLGQTGREILVPMRDTSGKLWGFQKIFSDGSKRFGFGQKKSGNFHVIPHIEALQDQSTIYIAEGFATAASIHESTGLAVVVAFDSGNLIKVCKSLKSKYEDKSFIICGDDDRFVKKPDGSPWNPGRESAEEAAKSVLGKTVYPVFKNDSLNLTDFNDLMISEGSEVVRNQILGVKPEKKTVFCLGYLDDTYYFISTEKPTVTPVSSGSFTKNKLLDLMPYSYWENRFPYQKGTGINVDSAVDILMRSCRENGIFLPRNVRGCGVWQDQKRTVVNTGDCLWVDGEVMNYTDFKSRYVYQAAMKISVPRDDFLSTDKLVEFESILSKLSWKKPGSAKILLGWLMVAPVCGSLRWRPHIWITGPSRAGKSTVMEMIVGKILGNRATKVMGRTSEAGIRQQIKSNALPLTFDENETTDKKSEARVSSVIELFRQASSESDSLVVKGTVSGKSLDFSVRFSAIVSSIRVGLQLEQDFNRFTVLEMILDRNNGFNESGGTREKLYELLKEEFCEQFYSRSIHKLPLILENFKRCYRFLEKEVDGRFADQYGSLMAGYLSSVSDVPISENDDDEFAKLFFDFGLDMERKEIANHDEDDCLEHLLNFKITENNNTYTIIQLVEYLNDEKLMDNEKTKYENTLSHYGIKVKDNNMYVSIKNPQLQNLFKDSKWPHGWGSALLRLPGARKETVWIHKTVKSVAVPISW